MWPSVGTASNENKLLEDDDDLARLCLEYNTLPLEKILIKHNAVRQESRNASTSGQRITKVLAITMFITKYQDQIVEWIYCNKKSESKINFLLEQHCSESLGRQMFEFDFVNKFVNFFEFFQKLVFSGLNSFEN